MRILISIFLVLFLFLSCGGENDPVNEVKETRLCDSNPCLNDGYCTDIETSIECIDKEVNQCFEYSYICECLIKYTGVNCEKERKCSLEYTEGACQNDGYFCDSGVCVRKDTSCDPGCNDDQFCSESICFDLKT